MVEEELLLAGLPPAEPPVGLAAAVPQAPVAPRTGVVVKLGGAAVTEKGEEERLASGRLAGAAAAVASAYEAWRRRGAGVVVVHGAGSFGHQHARRSGVARGSACLAEDAAVRLGVVATRRAVVKLSGLVVDALVDAGVPAVAVSPLGGWKTSGAHVACENVDCVRGLLAAGLVPVLHGDVVLDDRQGVAVLSGDTIVARLAQELGPSRSVFLTDVDGIFDRPPSEAGAKLLPEIAVAAASGEWAAVPGRDDGAAEAPRFESADHDVTGGIATKVAEASKVAGRGVPVAIARAGSDAAARALSPGALRRGFGGTLVRQTVSDAEAKRLGLATKPARHEEAPRWQR